jgi:putative chromate ion transporter
MPLQTAVGFEGVEVVFGTGECLQIHRRMYATALTDEQDHMPSWREAFLYFLFLGFVNVGGPVAQITLMYDHMVEKRRWLSRERFVKIMAFCHMLPGPEALQLAIYVGYLKRRLLGGVVAGLPFVLPGATLMVVLSWLYVRYGQLTFVSNALYVLKPTVVGIIAAGIIKLGGAAIRNIFLGRLAFLAIVWFKRDVALVAICGIVGRSDPCGCYSSVIRRCTAAATSIMPKARSVISLVR